MSTPTCTAKLLASRTALIPGGYRDALHSIANADYPIWRVQLQMTADDLPARA